MIAVGRRQHQVTLANPGTPQPDGDGGFTEVVASLTPSVVYAEIRPASARDLERLVAGTTMAMATHVVTMLYHPGVTTKTVVTFRGRTLHVIGVINPDERNEETVALCVERVS